MHSLSVLLAAKHVVLLNSACRFFAEKDINWWKTPPESPDAKPIENLWHELKVCENIDLYT